MPTELLGFPEFLELVTALLEIPLETATEYEPDSLDLLVLVEWAADTLMIDIESIDDVPGGSTLTQLYNLYVERAVR